MDKHQSRRDFIARLSALGLAPATAIPRLAQAVNTVKVGVVYVTPIGEIGWTKQHNLAAGAIEQSLVGKARVTEVENIFDPQDAERVFRQLALTGHQLIIGTSFSHGTPMQKVAPQFPKVAFEHCSGIKDLANLGTFEAKYYEAYYLAGIAAAHASKSGKLGYIGGFAVPDIIGMANALLLGAQSVKPSITASSIFLNTWYDPAKEKEAANALISQGCDVICSTTGTAAGSQAAEEKGAWSVGYASDMSKFAPTKQLTSMVLDWSGPYVQATQDVAAGKWRSSARWLGMKDGVVKTSAFNKSLSTDALAAIARAEQGIKAGTVHPFGGEIKDQGGKLLSAKGGVLPDAGIRSMNWFVQGMTGKL